MKVLADRIVEGLKKADHFAVYEADLEKFWPLKINHRETKISKFAQEHGLRLRFYKPGLCAIFDKAETGGTNGEAPRRGDVERRLEMDCSSANHRRDRISPPRSPPEKYR